MVEDEEVFDDAGAAAVDLLLDAPITVEDRAVVAADVVWRTDFEVADFEPVAELEAVLEGIEVEAGAFALLDELIEVVNPRVELADTDDAVAALDVLAGDVSGVRDADDVPDAVVFWMTEVVLDLLPMMIPVEDDAVFEVELELVGNCWPGETGVVVRVNDLDSEVPGVLLLVTDDLADVLLFVIELPNEGTSLAVRVVVTAADGVALEVRDVKIADEIGVVLLPCEDAAEVAALMLRVDTFEDEADVVGLMDGFETDDATVLLRVDELEPGEIVGALPDVLEEAGLPVLLSVELPDCDAWVEIFTLKVVNDTSTELLVVIADDEAEAVTLLAVVACDETCTVLEPKEGALLVLLPVEVPDSDDAAEVLRGGKLAVVACGVPLEDVLEVAIGLFDVVPAAEDCPMVLDLLLTVCWVSVKGFEVDPGSVPLDDGADLVPNAEDDFDDEGEVVPAVRAEVVTVEDTETVVEPPDLDETVEGRADEVSLELAAREDAVDLADVDVMPALLDRIVELEVLSEDTFVEVPVILLLMLREADGAAEDKEPVPSLGLDVAFELVDRVEEVLMD
ncbi:Hypothetical protein D9617_13g101100 [Elsinoe fawcettii]|nr:Hypothetical protein D9617_13g101100 [Elsinoe fawcettii]